MVAEKNVQGKRGNGRTSATSSTPRKTPVRQAVPKPVEKKESVSVVEDENEVSKVFTIRVKPESFDLAMKIAKDHHTLRPRLESDIYERGVLLTALLEGAGPQGNYGDLTPKQLAQRLRPAFARMYELLVEEEELPKFVHQSAVPPAMPYPMFAMPPMMPQMAMYPGGMQQAPAQPTPAQQSTITLSSEADQELSSMDEEI